MASVVQTPPWLVGEGQPRCVQVARQRVRAVKDNKRRKDAASRVLQVRRAARDAVVAVQCISLGVTANTGRRQAWFKKRFAVSRARHAMAELVLQMYVNKTDPETGETIWVNLATRAVSVRLGCCALGHGEHVSCAAVGAQKTKPALMTSVLTGGAAGMPPDEWEYIDGTPKLAAASIILLSLASRGASQVVLADTTGIWQRKRPRRRRLSAITCVSSAATILQSSRWQRVAGLVVCCTGRPVTTPRVAVQALFEVR